jgi:hypothetical protein
MMPVVPQMQYQMPQLKSSRLLIRPFESVDVDSVVDIGLALNADRRATAEEYRSGIERYILWSSLSYRELARLEQPPYGDRGDSQSTEMATPFDQFLADKNDHPGHEASKNGICETASDTTAFCTPPHPCR